MEEVKKGGFVKSLKTIYLYLVSFACVVVFIIGTVTLIDVALKTWIFPVTNEYYYPMSPVQSCTSETMKVMEFKNKDECLMYYKEQEKINKEQSAKSAVNERNQQLSMGISMTLVSLMIWLFHMYLARKEKKHGEA